MREKFFFFFATSSQRAGSRIYSNMVRGHTFEMSATLAKGVHVRFLTQKTLAIHTASVNDLAASADLQSSTALKPPSSFYFVVVVLHPITFGSLIELNQATDSGCY